MHLRQRTVDDVIGESFRQAVIMKNLLESVRHQQSLFRAVPACQNLKPDAAAGLKGYDRLQMRFDLTGFQRGDKLHAKVTGEIWLVLQTWLRIILLRHC